jgi:hypothetical protein
MGSLLGVDPASALAQPANSSSPPLATALSGQGLSGKALSGKALSKIDLGKTANVTVQCQKISSNQVLGAFIPPPADPPKTTGGNGTR